MSDHVLVEAGPDLLVGRRVDLADGCGVLVPAEVEDGPVRLRPCDRHGGMDADTVASSGSARVVRSGAAHDEVVGRLRASAGPRERIAATWRRASRRPETVLLVALDA